MAATLLRKKHDPIRSAPFPESKINGGQASDEPVRIKVSHPLAGGDQREGGNYVSNTAASHPHPNPRPGGRGFLTFYEVVNI
jgi:hypothetical protein